VKLPFYLTKMKIRRGKKHDAKELLHLLNKTPELQGNKNEKFYTINYVHGCLNVKDKGFVLIAEENKKIIGFLIAEIWKKKEYSFLDDIFVSPEFRRKDIASKLEKEYEKYCKKIKLRSIILLTLVKNKKMQKWCKKHNFVRGNKLYFYEKHL